MGAILRHQRLAFMKVDSSYELMGEGITDWTVAANPKNSPKQYVHQSRESGGLIGYAPSMSITAEAYSGDPVMEYIMDIAKTLEIGARAHTDIVIVDTWDGNSAVQQGVVISIDNPGSGAAGEALAVTATLTYSGDPVEGTFDLDTKTFTKAGA